MPEPYEEAGAEAQADLFALLERHAAEASSRLAAEMVASWEDYAGRFIRLVPKPQV